MEEYIDDEPNLPKKKNSVSRNLTIAISSVVLVCVLIFAFVSLVGGPYAVFVGFLFAIIAFPILSIIVGLGFMFASKVNEGGVMILLAIVGILIGFSICGGGFY